MMMDQMLDSFPSNMTYQDVLREMKMATFKQAQFDKDLDELLKKRQSIQKKIDSATFPVPELPLIRDESQKLNLQLTETSMSAHALSSKVRSLDTTQSRLREALGRVTAVLDLKNTIEKVNNAIDQHNFTMAAKATYRILHQQHSMKNDVSFSVLSKLEEKLRKQIVVSCQQAQQQEDTAKVAEYCLLLPYVDLPYQGLTIYCQVCRTRLKETLKDNHLTLTSQPAGAVLVFTDLIAKVFDTVATTISKHVRTVQEHFCPGAHARLLQEIQAEMDNQLTDILKRFIKDQKLAIISKHVKTLQTNANQQKKGGKEQLQDQKMDFLDPLSLDNLLEEIAFICRECEIFDINIREAASAAKAALYSVEEGSSDEQRHRKILEELKKDTTGTDLVYVSRVNELAQEIVGHYIALEEYYMIENINKAITIDEHIGVDDEANENEVGHGSGLYSTQLQRRFGVSLTSTMVDDTFFILKKCTERAFSTYSANTSCAVVNHIITILSTDYKEHMHRRVKAYYNIYSNDTSNETSLFKGSLFGSGGDQASEQEKKLQHDENFFLHLNNLQQSTEHMATLKEHLEAEFKQAFEKSLTGASKELVKHCLSEIAETSLAFRKLVQGGNRRLHALLLPKYKYCFDQFERVQYELTESDYNTNQANDPWVERLIRELESQLGPVKPCLTENNVTTLLTVIVDDLVQQIKKVMMKKRYTFWGGMQIDKDIRQLSAFCSSVCPYVHTVRDRFATLIQIASILQLDRVTEILDYWGGEGNQVWRLTEREVRQVLELRKDFKPRDIQNLKL